MSDLTAGLEALAAEFDEMDRMVSGGEHRAEIVRAAASALEDAMRENERMKTDREHLLNIVASLPSHETSAHAMGNAYWNWRDKMKDAIASARALVAKESAQCS